MNMALLQGCRLVGMALLIVGGTELPSTGRWLAHLATEGQGLTTATRQEGHIRVYRIIDYSVVDPRINWGPNGYGRGADGSAFEIDDARIPKSNIAIHHNYTRGNQGFLEVTWADLARNPTYRTTFNSSSRFGAALSAESKTTPSFDAA